MGEKLQETLTEILQGVLSAKDFVLTELPDVVEQLLVWKFCIHLILFSTGIMLVVVSYYGAKKLWISLKGSRDEMCIIFMLIPASGGVLMVCANLKWLQIWLAPKIYLIEYAARLTK